MKEILGEIQSGDVRARVDRREPRRAGELPAHARRAGRPPDRARGRELRSHDGLDQAGVLGAALRVLAYVFWHRPGPAVSQPTTTSGAGRVPPLAGAPAPGRHARVALVRRPSCRGSPAGAAAGRRRRLRGLVPGAGLRRARRAQRGGGRARPPVRPRPCRAQARGRRGGCSGCTRPAPPRPRGSTPACSRRRAWPCGWQRAPGSAEPRARRAARRRRRAGHGDALAAAAGARARARVLPARARGARGHRADAPAGGMAGEHFARDVLYHGDLGRLRAAAARSARAPRACRAARPRPFATLAATVATGARVESPPGSDGAAPPRAWAPSDHRPFPSRFDREEPE